MINNERTNTNWHTFSVKEIFTKLNSQDRGLESIEASSRLAENGPNSLPHKKPDSLFTIFLRQFANPIIYILLIATLIVFLLGDFIDGYVILFVLIINAVVGTVQEGRAQDTLTALRNMVQTNAVVFRDGKEIIISSEDVVVGDIIVLKEGDKIPADARIIELNDLKIDESALTGESEPVHKNINIIEAENIPAPDQKNMVFRGTYVIGGDARAVIVATASHTVIGGISHMLTSIDTDVPLKKNIQKLSRIIIIAVLIICTLIFIIGIFQNIPFKEMFIVAVAIAVSATPEGLPIVVTIVLADGMYRMSKQNALVRKLQAVEALGQATVIAVDKTGTITLNQMAVEKLWTFDGMVDIETNGYSPEGTLSRNEKTIEHLEHSDILLAGKISALTTSAAVTQKQDTNEWERISGDPTEAALLVFSRKVGFNKNILEQEYKKILDIPFSSKTKYHASINDTNEMNGDSVFSVSGAPEPILEKVTSIWKDGKIIKITDEDRLSIEDSLLSMASFGLRVMALAMRKNHDSSFTPGTLPELCFVGFVGISDSIRSDVYDALRRARGAGVKTIMITGDYPETAKAIGKKVGIFEEGDRVITGKELALMNDAELAHELPHTSVFARVSPEDKLKIIKAYRAKGDVIAMTGDGVNDALSLAAADLGVAMGKIGTEVAKEAADIVLLDDSFGSIVSAIEEGRNVYRSIKKVVLYLLSTSIGEIITIMLAMIMGYPVPLLATQIIWMNFITNSFPVIALALEPKEKDLLIPSKRKSSLIDRLMIVRMTFMSISMATVSLVLFLLYLDRGFVLASTVTLTALSLCQWYNAFNCRSENATIFTRNIFTNMYLIGSLVLVFGLQLIAVYVPFFQRILHTTSIGLNDWLIIAGMSLLVIIVEEIRKSISRFHLHLKMK